MFRKTMGEADSRRPRMDVGLGVWTDSTSRFYPVTALKDRGNIVRDTIGGREIIISIDPVSGVPAAEYDDIVNSDTPKAVDGVTGSSSRRLMQLFTRWYGFSYTFPGCEVFGE